MRDVEIRDPESAPRARGSEVLYFVSDFTFPVCPTRRGIPHGQHHRELTLLGILAVAAGTDGSSPANFADAFEN